MVGVPKSVNFSELLDRSAKLEKLATGFVFTEGPVWNRKGQFLLFSDVVGNVRRRWSERQGIVEVKRPSNKCNGMYYDPGGNLIVCEHITSTIVREYPDGTLKTLASHFGGKELNSPNDVTVRSDGSIYFTDPIYGRWPEVGLERESEQGFQGVYRITPENILHLAAPKDEFEQPNGLCFSPDESLLYINDTPRAHIKVFDVATDGSLSNRRLFFEGISARAPGEISSEGVTRADVPDGMKCDARGNIWVTGPGGIWVISPEGDDLSGPSRYRNRWGTSRGADRNGAHSTFAPLPPFTVCRPESRPVPWLITDFGDDV